MSHSSIEDGDVENILMGVSNCPLLEKFKFYIGTIITYIYWFYSDDTKCTNTTIMSVCSSLKSLKKLGYVRVWHPKSGCEDSVAHLRKVLKEDLKLWRMIEEADLT